jgi:predicted DNA-binding transcriptional regulator AlpA
MQGQWIQRPIDAPADDLLDGQAVSRLFLISKDTLDRLVSEGEFPQPLKIGKQGKFWDWRAVAYYRLRLELMSRIEAKDGETDRN